MALRILPREHQRRLQSVYAFARLVDYCGDEAPGDRTTLLRKVSRDLQQLYDGAPQHDDVLRGLAVTIAECNIPREPFDDLIQANIQDQSVHTYENWEQLLDYCRLSANPIGRIVLDIFGQAGPVTEKLSDHICSALQVLEHLQDIAEDAGNGRIYLPADDLARFSVAPEELTAATASRQLRALTAFETQRAVRLLDEGEPLIGELRGPGKVAVAGYLAGGRATAAAIAAAKFDTVAAPVRPTKGTTVRHAFGSLRRSRR